MDPIPSRELLLGFQNSLEYEAFTDEFRAFFPSTASFFIFLQTQEDSTPKVKPETAKNRLSIETKNNLQEKKIASDLIEKKEKERKPFAIHSLQRRHYRGKGIQV